MERNKEEAVRAKEIAEKKMQNGDFPEARNFALKARQLCPDIENITQLLMVCEVHCCAEKKINNVSVMDWYGILQIEQVSDEAAFKKRYRKLAFWLHPDKNKFAGAEAAFKLIGEANCVLTDPEKRRAFDTMCKALMAAAAAADPQPEPTPTPTPRRSNRKTRWNVPRNKFGTGLFTRRQPPPPPPPRPTFWTCCSSCGTRFQHYTEFMNKMLFCQNCQKYFLAFDVGLHGVPPGASWSESPDHGSSDDGEPAGDYSRDSEAKEGNCLESGNEHVDDGEEY